MKKVRTKMLNLQKTASIKPRTNPPKSVTRATILTITMSGFVIYSPVSPLRNMAADGNGLKILVLGPKEAGKTVRAPTRPSPSDLLGVFEVESERMKSLE